MIRRVQQQLFSPTPASDSVPSTYQYKAIERMFGQPNLRDFVLLWQNFSIWVSLTCLWNRRAVRLTSNLREEKKTLHSRCHQRKTSFECVSGRAAVVIGRSDEQLLSSHARCRHFFTTARKSSTCLISQIVKRTCAAERSRHVH